MKFGLTQEFSCGYLPDKQERLVVFVPHDRPLREQYQILIASGFRRSGEQIYRPHCLGCRACESIRVPVADFKPSRSQKRTANKNKDLRVIVSPSDKEEYYPLYEAYINARHSDGSMYPASREQYRNFILCSWLEQRFIEFWLEDELIGVAVTDVISDGLSALYTFFAPGLDQRSLGTFAILEQINLAKRQGKDFVYLGYQIDDCAKMNYKSNFYPHHRFRDNQWYLCEKPAKKP